MGKKRKYNLSDGEEDDFELQDVNSLAEMDDFEDEILPDDNDDAETAETASTPVFFIFSFCCCLICFVFLRWLPSVTGKELILKHINAQAVQSSLDRNSLEGEENVRSSPLSHPSRIICFDLSSSSVVKQLVYCYRKIY